MSNSCCKFCGITNTEKSGCGHYPPTKNNRYEVILFSSEKEIRRIKKTDGWNQLLWVDVKSWKLIK